MPNLGIIASSISGNLSSYESIATVSGTGSSGTISFTSIPSTYSHLQIRAISLVATTDQILFMRFNSDTGSNYASHLLTGNGVGAGASNALTSQANMKVFGQTYALGTTAPTGTVTDILDYANTNKYKTMRSFGGTDRNGTGEVQLASGLWMNTAAISSIQLTTGANFTTTTQFALYGIR